MHKGYPWLRQESLHRAQNLRVLKAQQPGIQKDPPYLQWPPASRKSEWCHFDDGFAGANKNKNFKLWQRWLWIATERFDPTEKGKTEGCYSKNWRANKMMQLRKQLCLLRKQLKS